MCAQRIKWEAKVAWWEWPSVLSLDAPVVAVVWQLFFAKIAGVTLQSHHLILLSMAAWVIYAADRWLEGFEIPVEHMSTHRHRFYQHYRWPLAATMVTVSTFLILLATGTLTDAEWKTILWVAFPVGLYLGFGPWVRKRGCFPIPKEIIIAILFTAGTATLPFAQSDGNIKDLTIGVIWFFFSAMTNLLLIARWELEIDKKHNQPSIIRSHPVLMPVLPWIPWLLALTAGIAAALDVVGPSSITASTSAAAILMGILDQTHHRIGPERARSLIDLALLSPLWFLLQ